MLSEAGLHLAVATSKPQVFAVKILEHFHLAQYFDYIGGAELDGAKALGIDCIGMLYGYGTREELSKAGAVYIAETPLEAAKWLLG